MLCLGYKLKAILIGLSLSCALLVSATKADNSQVMTYASVVKKSELFTAKRQGTLFWVELTQPHTVLSTSAYNGGQHHHIQYLVNHQSMEAKGDTERFMSQLTQSKQSYHQSIASKLGVNAEQMALMGTAANMHQMAEVTHSFKHLDVQVFVTAGVKGNAQRAGDTAHYAQTIENGRVINRSVKQLTKTQPAFKPQNSGTINIMVLINQPISSGAQAKVAMLATEAKSAALAELAIGSKKSPHLATGTGTDQLIVASPSDKSIPELVSASGHLKLGELVGSAVKQAVKEALLWQNGLTAANSGNVIHALSRFGLTEAQLLSQLKIRLPEQSYSLAEQNFKALIHDARLTASAYAYASLLDRIQYGALPKASMYEVIRDQAAQAAVSLSSKPHLWPKYWQTLETSTLGSDLQNQLELINVFAHAVALGWQQKW